MLPEVPVEPVSASSAASAQNPIIYEIIEYWLVLHGGFVSGFDGQ